MSPTHVHACVCAHRHLPRADKKVQEFLLTEKARIQTCTATFIYIYIYIYTHTHTQTNIIAGSSDRREGCGRWVWRSAIENFAEEIQRATETIRLARWWAVWRCAYQRMCVRMDVCMWHVGTSLSMDAWLDVFVRVCVCMQGCVYVSCMYVCINTNTCTWMHTCTKTHGSRTCSKIHNNCRFKQYCIRISKRIYIFWCICLDTFKSSESTTCVFVPRGHVLIC